MPQQPAERAPEPSGEPAATLTVTSTELLAGLRDPANQTLWHQYVGRYRPLIVRYGRRLGLSNADAEDVAQVSLLDFSTRYCKGSYDREQGRLRDWLFGFVANRVRNLRRSAGRRRRLAPADPEQNAALRRLESREDLQELWEQEWRDTLLAQCMGLVRQEFQEKTFLAFQAFAVEGRPAEEVAAELDLTPNAVYGAKRRVLRRVRELLPVLEDTW